MYAEFAGWYDRMMRGTPYDVWAEYLKGFLKEAGASSVLECASGTGNLSVRLAAAGYQLTASDLSEDMLMVHREKMRKARLNYPVIRQDMNRIVLHRQVDAVIAACDGVNYLTGGSEPFFQSAFAALRPGGLLLFDISSAYKLSRLAGTSFSDSDDDWAYICDCSREGDDLLRMELTAFVREGELFRRFEESHLQRIYSVEEIIKTLQKAGFEMIEKYDCFTDEPAGETSDRIQFVAVKPLC